MEGTAAAKKSAERNLARPAIPIFGTYQLADGEIQFRPRFAFRPGVTYRATFSPALLPDGDRSTDPIEHRFTLAGRRQPPTAVAAVYPTATVVPENLLKFYVCFSAPMRQAVALEHVRLLRTDGTLIADPFVNVGQELWDRSGKRLTLLFDPGRIKQGLRPRQELGLVLQQGAEYVLQIDSAWKDAAGRPLQQRFPASPP